MKDVVVITGYKDMCFESGQGKEKQEVDFVKITCLTKNNGSDSVGYLPLQLSYTDKKKSEILKQLPVVPALYNAEYAMVPGKNNSAKLEIVGFELIRPLEEFRDLFEA